MAELEPPMVPDRPFFRWVQQNKVFDRLRRRPWWQAPLISSSLASAFDTVLSVRREDCLDAGFGCHSAVSA